MKHIPKIPEDDKKIDAFIDLCKRMFERMEKDGSLAKLDEVKPEQPSSSKFDSPKVVSK